jgi:hypothetical protein
MPQVDPFNIGNTVRSNTKYVVQPDAAAHGRSQALNVVARAGEPASRPDAQRLEEMLVAMLGVLESPRSLRCAASPGGN